MKKNKIFNDLAYMKLVKNILENDEFTKRENFEHHINKSVYDHCLYVSYYSYKIAKKLHLDEKSAAIGGLLHDFYDEPWICNIEKKNFFEKHGFVHAKKSLLNSKKHFSNLIDKKVENIILRHMFPLNIIPPKYMESWIVSFVDKYTSLEIFLKPKYIPIYLGIKKGGKNER
ncbi:MAG TPA: HD domain-containing protein [Tenericutes bacterium]|nr:HD domain-containing protein [Mycoplasmatota bacterium]